MNLRNTACLVVFLMAVCLAGAQDQKAGAQDGKKETTKQEEQPFTFSVGANMVLVPVVVTDGKGNHITGLKREDFEIKEDGKVQTIARLDELTAEAAKVPVAAAGQNRFSNEVDAEHPRKLEIIAVDRINTTFADNNTATRGLVNFLSKGVDSNTLLALISLDPNGISLIHNFTSDPAVLVAAVRKLQGTLTSRDARIADIPGDTPEVDAEAQELQALFNGADLAGATTPNQAAAAARALRAQARAQVDASVRDQGGLATLECLQQVAEYFRGVPGRKSLIWASAAFPFSFGAEARELTRGTTYGDWQATFHALQDANISMYPVDVSGLLPGTGGANTLQNIDSSQIMNNSAGGIAARTQQLDAATNGAFLNPTDARHETMGLLADMTGGEAFYNSNNAAALFHKAGDDAGQYYMIGYYTKDTTKPGWRKISVKVRHEHAKVRARSGYFFHPVGTDADRSKVTQEMMALNSDLSFTAVPIHGEWQPTQPAGAQRKVPFVLSLPAGVALVDTEHQNRISLDFRILARNAAGKIAAQIGERLATNLDQKGVAEIQTKGIDYNNVLTLDPGEYKVNFVVRDNLRGTLGSIVVPLHVQ
ncbi:MAG TPA: VWA domain-containing protein [Candidatus Angelobacter sp.]|nr:VWA domain-containing protein [Candidatus Angelobacter sp.]